MPIRRIGLFSLLILAFPLLAAADPPPQAYALLERLQAERAAAPVFAESFRKDLQQWGLSTPLGDGGMILDRAAGSVPGVRQLFIPGLSISNGVIACEVRLEENDQGYIAFRVDDDRDKCYQLRLSTGGEASGFLKKHNLDQLYGGGAVGETYTHFFSSRQWLPVAIYCWENSLLAMVDGQIVAYYDQAEGGSGGICFFQGAGPLAVRNLSVSLFGDDKPTAPYKQERAKGAPPDPRVPAPPTGIPDTFATTPPLYLLPPRSEANVVSGIVPGARGARHTWRLDADNRFTLDGEALIPLRDTDGVYFAQVPEDVLRQRAVESLRDDALLARIRRDGLPFLPARVRLVDYINPLATDHEFSEEPVLGGRSRILTLCGRRCRVTASRRWLSYFAYTARTDAPLVPHLLLAETPNDRERDLCLRIQPADGSGGNPDYGVGAGVFTGRGLPTNGQLYCQSLLFTPHTERIRFTISHMPIEEGRDNNNGAAVSQIFLFALADPLAACPNPVLPATGEEARTLALAVPSARALLRQEGAYLDSPAATAVDRAAGYRSFLHRLRFLGFNGVDPGVLDLTDDGIRPEYTGSQCLTGGVERDLFSTLLPLAERAGVTVTPVIPPIPLTPQAALTGAFPEEWILIDRDGQPCRTGKWPALNLLAPDAAEWLAQLAAEVAERCRASSAVRGVAVEVDGDRGNCLPQSGACSPAESGYGAADIERFCALTGERVPTGNDAYSWLRANDWTRWEDWRCDQFYALWLRVRNRLQEIQPAWRLLLNLSLPDRQQARPRDWAEAKTPLTDLLRDHGFDPERFAACSGIQLARSFDIGYDRVRAFQHRENAAALNQFDYQKELAGIYRSGEPNAVTIRIAPWEEYGQRLGSEFYPAQGGNWGASTVTPWGRALFRPLTRALRESNPARVSVSGVEYAVAGREPDWRRFARAFRALPAVEPALFSGKVTQLSPAGKLPEDLLVSRYGDRIGVINDSDQARKISLQPEHPLRPGECWVDLATGKVLLRATDRARELVLDLDGYDLRTLAVLPEADPLW